MSLVLMDEMGGVVGVTYSPRGESDILNARNRTSIKSVSKHQAYMIAMNELNTNIDRFEWVDQTNSLVSKSSRIVEKAYALEDGSVDAVYEVTLARRSGSHSVLVSKSTGAILAWTNSAISIPEPDHVKVEERPDADRKIERRQLPTTTLSQEELNAYSVAGAPTRSLTGTLSIYRTSWIGTNSVTTNLAFIAQLTCTTSATGVTTSTTVRPASTSLRSSVTTPRPNPLPSNVAPLLAPTPVGVSQNFTVRLNAVFYNKENIESGGFTSITYPNVTQASPSGWLSGLSRSGVAKTSGNNADVVSKKGYALSTLGAFNFTFSPNSDPSSNSDFVTNNNQYQTKGSGDAIQAVVQTDGVPSIEYTIDGEAPLVNLPTLPYSDPPRDTALDNTIVYFVLSQGMISRILSSNGAFCSATPESGSAVLGTSMALSMILTTTTDMTATTPRYLGAYSYNLTYGVKNYPFTTLTSVNPLMYSNIAAILKTSVKWVNFRAGEAFGNILYEMFWALAGIYPITNDVLADLKSLKTWTKSGYANTLALGLITQAMTFTGCNPDVILLGQVLSWSVEYYLTPAAKCAVAKAFAKRGLGIYATPGTDNFDIPSSC
ncbi:hypothetical protein HDU97_002261 [Phlyctochytrium planicorne]|nr:hypothetical protein HDU97_002261 [Phlyctochytrium planicorne]